MNEVTSPFWISNRRMAAPAVGVKGLCRMDLGLESRIYAIPFWKRLGSETWHESVTIRRRLFNGPNKTIDKIQTAAKASKSGFEDCKRVFRQGAFILSFHLLDCASCCPD